jgi:hypothetical protein
MSGHEGGGTRLPSDGNMHKVIIDPSLGFYRLLPRMGAETIRR